MKNPCVRFHFFFSNCCITRPKLCTLKWHLVSEIEVGECGGFTAGSVKHFRIYLTNGPTRQNLGLGLLSVLENFKMFCDTAKRKDTKFVLVRVRGMWKWWLTCMVAPHIQSRRVRQSAEPATPARLDRLRNFCYFFILQFYIVL